MLQIYGLNLRNAASTASCIVGREENVPRSLSLLVVRNHVFMTEFHDYLLNFLVLFHYFTCNSQASLQIHCSVKTDIARFKSHFRSNVV